MRAIQTPPPGDAEPSTGRQGTESLLWRAAYAVVSAYLGQCYARFLEPPDVAERGNAVERAERLLARLAPQERDALTYRLIGNCSLDETAARMGLSAQAALALQWRALTHATRLAEQDVTLGAYTPRATSDDAR
jgi:DNA-directed RNA polymerase specialized sigma24 family protein